MNDLFRLHERLTLDRSQAFNSTAQGWRQVKIEPTQAGRAWLHDYHTYQRLYRKLNGRVYRGTGPADQALNKQFGFVISAARNAATKAGGAPAHPSPESG